MDGIYFYATSGDWDGIAMFELPDRVTAEALCMMVQATRNFQKQVLIPYPTCDCRAVQSGDGEGATSQDRLHATDHDEIALGNGSGGRWAAASPCLDTRLKPPGVY
jgi:hypothetical protein